MSQLFVTMVGNGGYFTLSLSVSLTAASCDVQDLAILSRRLRTKSLPTTHASVGYSQRNKRFISFKEQLSVRLHVAISLQRYTFILRFARKSEKKVIDEGFFYLTRPLLLGSFRKSSPVPFFTLKEGAPPLFPKSPFPSGYRGLNR